MAEETKKKVPLVKGMIKILPDGQANLVGMKCNSCSEIMFPKTTLCGACGKEDVEEIDLSTRGKVWTFTTVHVSYGSICLTPPYVAAFVELEDGGYVYTPILGCEPEDVKIGMDVELELLKTGESEEGETMIYAFRPVEA